MYIVPFVEIFDPKLVFVWMISIRDLESHGWHWGKDVEVKSKETPTYGFQPKERVVVARWSLWQKRVGWVGKTSLRSQKLAHAHIYYTYLYIMWRLFVIYNIFNIFSWRHLTGSIIWDYSQFTKICHSGLCFTACVCVCVCVCVCACVYVCCVGFCVRSLRSDRGFLSSKIP